MLNFISALLGGALLVAGRKLFWLFVGVIGFIIGGQIAARFFHGSELTTLIAAIALGIISAVLTIFLESLSITIAGFLGGGYILLMLATSLGVKNDILIRIAFIVGGIIGAALIIVLFDWALITISSLAGASLIIGAFHPANSVLIFFILLIIGVAIQGSALRAEKRGSGAHGHA